MNNIPTKYIDIFCVAVLLLLPTSLRNDRFFIFAQDVKLVEMKCGVKQPKFITCCLLMAKMLPPLGANIV